MTTLAEIPLRQRKQAQTRLALLDAVLARLDGKRTLDDIPVKELCDAANISQASFFNYFPSKTDLLVYFVQIWSLDLAGRVHTGAGGAAGSSAREAIESIFVSTAREARQHGVEQGEAGLRLLALPERDLGQGRHRLPLS